MIYICTSLSLSLSEQKKLKKLLYPFLKHSDEQHLSELRCNTVAQQCNNKIGKKDARERKHAEETIGRRYERQRHTNYHHECSPDEHWPGRSALDERDFRRAYHMHNEGLRKQALNEPGSLKRAWPKLVSGLKPKGERKIVLNSEIKPLHKE